MGCEHDMNSSASDNDSLPPPSSPHLRHTASADDIYVDNMTAETARRPSGEEQARTFTGLESQPKLIATSRRLPWDYKKWDILLTPAAFNGKLLEAWQGRGSSMVAGFSAVMRANKLPWNAMDILGFFGVEPSHWDKPSDTPPEVPIVLLISIKPTTDDPIMFARAANVIESFIKIMKTYDIHDIPIDVKEGEIIRGSGRADNHDHQPQLFYGPPLTPFSDRLLANIDNDAAFYWSEYLGSEIGNSRCDFGGSTGLWLDVCYSCNKDSDAPSTKAHLALCTCRHVIFPSIIDDHKDFTLGSTQKETMTQPHVCHARAVVRRWEDKIKKQTDDVRDMNTRLNQLYKGDMEANEAEIDEFQEGIKISEEIVTLHLERIEDLNRLIDQDSLVSGRALCAPAHAPVSKEEDSSLPSGKHHTHWLRDWGLVTPEPSRFSTWPPKNHVRILSETNRLTPLFTPQEQSEYDDLYRVAQRNRGKIQLSGVVPEKELRAGMTDTSRNANSKNRLLVGKYGKTTLLRMGFCNAYDSITRNPSTSAKHEVPNCREFCIVQAIPGELGHMPRTFSQPSDSGACVWRPSDRKVCGMMTGGNGQGGVTDITYMTSMEDIIKDMATYGIVAKVPEARK